jgi:hypothetical protein
LAGDGVEERIGIGSNQQASNVLLAGPGFYVWVFRISKG